MALADFREIGVDRPGYKKTTLAMAQELTAQILSEETAGVEEG